MEQNACSVMEGLLGVHKVGGCPYKIQALVSNPKHQKNKRSDRCECEMRVGSWETASGHAAGGQNLMHEALCFAASEVAEPWKRCRARPCIICFRMVLGTGWGKPTKKNLCSFRDLSAELVFL